MTEIVLSASQIMIDPALLPERPLDRAWAMRLEEAAQQGHDLRPLLVAKMGDHYILIGGAHRLETWKRHYKTDDPKVRCIVIPWTDFKDMRGRAIRDNMHGKPYTEPQLKAMFLQLTTREGWTREEAMRVLGLSDARVDRIIEEQRRESEPQPGSQPGAISEPEVLSQPAARSEPMCESQPDLLSEPENTSQPTQWSELKPGSQPETTSEPLPLSHPGLPSEPRKTSNPPDTSAFPSPDDNAINTFAIGMQRRRGYRVNQFTQQNLDGLRIWIEEAYRE